MLPQHPRQRRIQRAKLQSHRGEDRWLGRTVRKNFAGFGVFKGIVDAVDEDEDVPGHRIFHVVWEDGDDAWISVDELVDILQHPDDDSATVCAICVTAVV